MSYVIACLSQKGGVGKSTLARLLARTFAIAGWSVKICDFNTRQLTSVDWVAVRMQQGMEPEIAAEPMNSVKKLKGQPFDLLVIDGAPDSDINSLEAARIADLVVIPTGLTADDLRPQVRFANELVSKGVPLTKLIFVLNKTTESDLATREAAGFLKNQGFLVADTDLAAKTGYQMAQNSGAAVSETKYSTLNERADTLAAEIVDRLNELKEIAA
jgi:chromosome partitioning protein